MKHPDPIGDFAAVYRLFVVSLLAPPLAEHPAPGFVAMQPLWVDSVTES